MINLLYNLCRFLCLCVLLFIKFADILSIHRERNRVLGLTFVYIIFCYELVEYKSGKRFC